MSRYAVNKFLYQVDGDPALLAEYKADPAALVARWEADIGPWLGTGARTVERTSWIALDDDERRALVEHDYAALFELGAHFFLTLTIFIALYDEEYAARSGPLSFQREYAAKLALWTGREYPSIAL